MGKRRQHEKNEEEEELENDDSVEDKVEGEKTEERKCEVGQKSLYMRRQHEKNEEEEELENDDSVEDKVEGEKTEERKCEVGHKSLQMKRSLKEQEEDEEEEEERKRLRLNPDIADRSSGDVKIYGKPGNDSGDVLEYETFTRKDRVCRKSLLEAKAYVCDSKTLETGCYLYPAFKEAILRLLSEIELILANENNQVQVMLIHGVPNIGKTTLSRCLAYLLALTAEKGETVHRIAYKHREKQDTGAMTDSITRRFRCRLLIVDQVNTNSIDLLRLSIELDNRLNLHKIAMPLIMFTSGHYAPGEDWIEGHKAGWINYKIIQMRSDAAVVDQLRKQNHIHESVAVSNEDILEVTNIYKRVSDCMKFLKGKENPVPLDTMRRKIYSDVDIDFLKRESLMHVVWVTWEMVFSKGLPCREEFTDDFCRIEPPLVECLGCAIGAVKDGKDKGINALLNQMDITGDALYDNNNYSEFDIDSYRYIFLRKNSVYKLLQDATEFFKRKGPKEKLKVFVQGFYLLQEEGSQANAGRGILLEYIIKYSCIAHKRLLDYRFAGMVPSSRKVTFREVDHYQEVCTVEELCRLPFNTEACKMKDAHVFCFLNAPGKRAFKGYDFVYVRTRCVGGKIEVIEMHIFQVTVNIQSKEGLKSTIMAEVLLEIKGELQRLKLIKTADADAIVKPYFVVPLSNDEKIVLPSENMQKTISVDVLELQLKSLKNLYE